MRGSEASVTTHSRSSKPAADITVPRLAITERRPPAKGSSSGQDCPWRCIRRNPTGSVCSPSAPPTSTSLIPRPAVCKEFFLALEACHANNWRKWTGGCNNDKNELNMCLRQVVRLPIVDCCKPVPLTVVGAATGCFGAKSRAREGTTEENRERVGGTAPG